MYSDEDEKNPGMDISIPMTIAELIAARAQIIEAWHEANRAIDSIDAAFARIHDKDFRMIDDSRRGGQWEPRQDKVKIDRMISVLDYSLFVFALGKLNITNAMTETAKDAFLAKVKEAKTVFDEKQLTGLAQNAHKLFRDSSLNTVREVFRKCIGTSYRSGKARMERKRDNLQKIERCFRVGWSDIGISQYGGGIEDASRRYNQFSGFRFNDLLTACRLIDGEGIPDYSNNLYALCRATPKGQHWVDTGYFVATAYQNGNVKVTWKEDKIHVLEKLNAIGSGRENAMPDTMRKRYKSEHFRDRGMPKAETYFAPDADMVPSDDKDFAFYPTPEPVAARMVELAALPTDHTFTILEPSAGDGAILRAIPSRFDCWAVEFNHHRAAKLRNAFPFWTVTEADFLKWTPDMVFPRVFLNPPFNDRIEAVHVVKAFSHLRSNGILVGIIPDGWFTREDTKSVVFREFLTRHQHKEPELLPAGTFGRTRVVTRIITLRRPD